MNVMVNEEEGRALRREAFGHTACSDNLLICAAKCITVFLRRDDVVIPTSWGTAYWKALTVHRKWLVVCEFPVQSCNKEGCCDYGES